MNRNLVKIIFLGLLSSGAALAPDTVEANNRAVENALANYSDVSVFYQALLNSGVLNQLDENTHYTIFAPTNAAFSEIRPDVYPCFYAARCRPQVADVLRDHIVIGRRSREELAKQAEVPTLGRNWIYAESPYVHDYTVASRHILSGEELNGNMIYRIDGVIISNPQLAQFETMPPAVARNMRTIVTYSPVSYPVPGAGYEPVNTPQTIVEKKTYVTPEGYPAGSQTTITRTINP